MEREKRWRRNIKIHNEKTSFRDFYVPEINAATWSETKNQAWISPWQLLRSCKFFLASTSSGLLVADRFVFYFESLLAPNNCP